MTGSMGRTSLAEGLLRVTPLCCLQSATRGERSTRWCTRAPPSPMPSRISGATSSSGNERSMRTGPTRSKPKGKGGKGKSPNSPSVPWPDHWAFKNPKGVAYCRDHHLHNKCSGSCGRSTTARSGRMGGCVCPPIEACATGMPSPSQVTGGVSVGIIGHQCESAHRSRKPLHRRRGAVPARALQKGGSILSPAPTEAVGRPEVRIRPARGVPRERQGKQGGSDKGHTQSLKGGQAPPWMQDIPERLRLMPVCAEGPGHGPSPGLPSPWSPGPGAIRLPKVGPPPRSPTCPPSHSPPRTHAA